MTGRIHSIQTLGTLDGPGVRFVVFVSGCPLRCSCCHNPDTWDFSCGTEMSVGELAERASRYREYFGSEGGITLSGGEPLCQAPFAAELFALCRERGIGNCLDTSGCLINDDVRALLRVTDRVLLDIKYTNEDDYRDYVGCEYRRVLDFLTLLSKMHIPTVLRQVIIPTLNDCEDNIKKLRALAEAHPNVERIELLPFRKLCQSKYDSMGLDFRFGHLPEPSLEQIVTLNSLLIP